MLHCRTNVGTFTFTLSAWQCKDVDAYLRAVLVLALSLTGIREGDGFLIVYAINSAESFDEAELIRGKIIRILDADPDDPDIPIVLVGNKSDLENERKVQRSELDEKKNEWKCPVFETSAKEKTNIDESFFQVVREIRKRKEPQDEKPKGKSGKSGGLCTIL